MTKIKNTEEYAFRMRKSLKDKLFFLPFIKDADVFLDFGCADGYLLSAIRTNKPKAKLIGIDYNEDMIKMCKTRNLKDAWFVGDLWEGVERAISFQEKEGFKVVLVLSSTLHEIQSYIKSPQQAEKVYEELFGWGANYITVRDMGIAGSKYYNRLQANLIRGAAKIRKKMPKEAEDYECRGNTKGIKECSLLMYRHYVEFLLKYRYTENWQRELEEKYLLNIDELKATFKKFPYDEIYFEHYSIPFINEQIKKDFDIEFHERTHIKTVYKLKD